MDTPDFPVDVFSWWDRGRTPSMDYVSSGSPAASGRIDQTLLTLAVAVFLKKPLAEGVALGGAGVLFGQRLAASTHGEPGSGACRGPADAPQAID